MRTLVQKLQGLTTLGTNYVSKRKRFRVKLVNLVTSGSDFIQRAAFIGSRFWKEEDSVCELKMLWVHKFSMGCRH